MKSGGRSFSEAAGLTTDVSPEARWSAKRSAAAGASLSYRT